MPEWDSVDGAKIKLKGASKNVEIKINDVNGLKRDKNVYKVGTYDVETRRTLDYRCWFCVRVEEYQELVDDIIRDGRLYASHQHQDVLKVGPSVTCTAADCPHIGQLSLASLWH